jgi:hypothetical protein
MLSAALARSVAVAIARLDHAVETACASVSEKEADALRAAKGRSVEALQRLGAVLAGKLHSVEELSRTGGDGQLPELSEAAARKLLKELDDIIAHVEHTVLEPAEQELKGEALGTLRRLVGQAWGWIVCDLQDPLWRQYPKLAPPPL